MVERNNNPNKFDDSNEEFDEDIEVTDEGIYEPFDPTKIRVETRKITIDLVLARIKYEELDLAPDFQRQAGIWTDDAKSRLIESILIRIPLPAFYMDATDDDKWLVIDGLQRLTTLKEFIIDKTLKLTGLQYLTDIENKNYDELHRKYQRRILETELTLYLIEKGTPPAVKYNIFRRINTGGLPLTPQEIRHALNQGKATAILDELSKSDEFKQATDFEKLKKQTRMLDREFVLGFLAYTINDYQDFNKYKSRDEFFVETMNKINKKISDKEINEIKNNFKRSMVAAYNIFGKNAFRKISQKNSRRYPLNQALFEALSVNISKLNDSELDVIQNRKKDFIDRFTYLVDNDNEFSKSISQASQKVAVRFRRIEDLIREVLA